MPVDLRDALHTQIRGGQSRRLLLVVSLALLVIAAAALSGAVRFGGPRWRPGTKSSSEAVKGRTLPTTASPPPTRRQTGQTAPTIPLGLVIAILGGFVLAFTLLLFWRWWLRRPPGAGPSTASVAPPREPPVEPEVEPAAEMPELLTGLDRALATLEEGREPTDAIVRAWLGLQETAEESGILRRPAETPTEFTARILGRAFADDDAIRALLRLYLRTRFGDHPVTGEDVAAARSALERLVGTWRASGHPASAGGRR